MRSQLARIRLRIRHAKQDANAFKTRASDEVIDVLESCTDRHAEDVKLRILQANFPGRLTQPGTQISALDGIAAQAYATALRSVISGDSGTSAGLLFAASIPSNFAPGVQLSTNTRSRDADNVISQYIRPKELLGHLPTFIRCQSCGYPPRLQSPSLIVIAPCRLSQACAYRPSS